MILKVTNASLRLLGDFERRADTARGWAQGWTQLQKAERRIGSNAGRANINGSY